MKKLLTLLCLALALCMLCGAALAENHPKDAEGNYIHSFPNEVGEQSYVVYPNQSNPNKGLIRFRCVYAGEYGDTDGHNYVDAGADFQEWVVQPYYSPFYKLEEVYSPDTGDGAKITNEAAVADYKLPTCTEGGYVTVYRKPLPSNPYLVKDGVIYKGWEGGYSDTHTYTLSANGHKWSEQKTSDPWRKNNDPYWTEIVAPTCTSEGKLQSYCLVCKVQREQYRTTDKLPHDFSDNKEIIVEATCVATGTKTTWIECSICHAEKPESRKVEILEIDQFAHKFGKWIKDENQSVDPTCTEGGKLSEYQLCGLCLKAKNTRVKDLDPLGHDLGKWYVTKAATCVEKGEARRDCSRCDYFKTHEIDENPDNHPFEAMERIEADTIPAVCLTDGQYHYKCTACGADRYEKIPAPGYHEDVRLWRTADPEDVTCSEDVDGRPWTQDKCFKCGHEFDKVYGEKPAHDWTKWTLRNPYEEGGEAVGTAAYWIRQCKVCGKHDEEIRNDNVDMNDSCSVDGHSYEAVVVAPSCTEQGYTLHTCSKCGDSYKDEYVDALGHAWDEGVVTKEPTYDVPGEMTYTCTVCGETKTEAIDPIDRPEADYEMGEIKAKGGSITAEVKHVKDTAEADALFARVTLIIDGRFVSYSMPVINNMVNIYVEGDIEAVSIEITGTSSIVPGTYVSFCGDYYWF